MFKQFQQIPRAAKIGGGLAAASIALGSAAAYASSDSIHPPSFPWAHYGVLSGFDHASIRRGHIVFSQVCASCHSLNHIAWRNLVNVAYSESEVKAMAAEQDYEDGPNDEGEMFMRPGKLTDVLPKPYKNPEAARAANGGALPPDLSLITKGRVGYEDYIFALITGYKEPPAGMNVRQGLYYNPYMHGGVIAMPPPLIDEAVTFPDGTKASASQMAKDVVEFLAWCAEPELEERKRLGMSVIAILTIGAIFTGYYKRFKWAPLKTRKVWYRK